MSTLFVNTLQPQSGDKVGVTGSFAVTNHITASNGLTVTGSARFKDEVELAGNLTVAGTTTLAGMSFTNVTASNGLTVTGSARFKDEVEMASSLDITGDLTVIGTTTLAGMSFTNVTASNGLTVTGSARFKDEVEMVSSLDVAGDTTAAAITTTGDVKVGSQAGSGKDLFMYTAGTAAHVGIQWDANGETEGILIGGADDHGVDLKFFGETTGKYMHWDMSADKLEVRGHTSFGNAIADTHTFTGHITSSNNLLVSGELSASNGATFSGVAVTASAGIVVTGSAKFKDEVELAGNLTVLGTTNLAGISLSLVTASNGLTVTGSARFKDEVEMASSLDVAGALSADSLTVNGDLTFNGDTTTFSSPNEDDPIIIIKNTMNNAAGARLRLVKDKGAAGAAGDVAGVIEFYADDANQDNILFAGITGSVQVHTNGQEGGKLTLTVASNDGEIQPGLIIVDGDAEDEVDVTLGNGADSIVTIPGDIDLEGDIDVNGVANLDNTDIDGTFTMDGTAFDVNATSTCAIDNTNTTNGITINTNVSGGPISIGHSTSETTVNDNLSVTGDLAVDGTSNLDEVDIDGAVQIDGNTTFGVANVGVDVKFFGNSTDVHMLWDASEDDLLLTDQAQIRLGDSQDFSIKHTASHNYLIGTTGHIIIDNQDNSSAVKVNLGNDAATTDFRVQNNSTDVSLKVDGAGDIKFHGNGAGEYLLWDRSADSLLLTDATLLRFGDTPALTIKHATHNYIESTNGHIVIDNQDVDAAVKVMLGTDTTTTDFRVQNNSAEPAFVVHGDKSAVFSGSLNVEGDATFSGDTATFSSANDDDPLVIIKNTTNGAGGSRLRFVKDKGAAGAANDVAGVIEFYADDSGQNQTCFGGITGSVAVHTNGQEGGKLTLTVASHNGTLTTGLELVDGNASGEVDVTLGSGADSIVTIPGDIDLEGDIDVNGVANLDNTDIDGTFTMDGTAFDVNATSTCAIDNSNTSNGITIGTATSGVPISIGHSTSETTINDNLTITGDLAVNGDTTTFTSANDDDPLIVIKNTTAGAGGARLRFTKDKGANGAANDVAGVIEFFADDSGQNQTCFAGITGSVAVHTDGQEGGKLQFNVASHDGELQPGLIITDGSVEDEVDVTLGNKSTSVTTIAGILKLGDGTTDGVAGQSTETSHIVFGDNDDFRIYYDEAGADGLNIVGGGGSGASVSIIASANDQGASLSLISDASADAGDQWQISSEGNNTFKIGCDAASQFTIAPIVTLSTTTGTNANMTLGGDAGDANTHSRMTVTKAVSNNTSTSIVNFTVPGAGGTENHAAAVRIFGLVSKDDCSTVKAFTYLGVITRKEGTEAKLKFGAAGPISEVEEDSSGSTNLTITIDTSEIGNNTSSTDTDTVAVKLTVVSSTGEGTNVMAHVELINYNASGITMAEA